MSGLKKIAGFIPKRLVATTILMALILVLIVLFIFSLINEKSRIQSALALSQQNREQILRTESVTESMVVVDARFKEYCTTFERAAFEEYQTQVKRLTENIELLQQTFDNVSGGASGQINKIFDEKTREADIYMRLRQITDSLIFSTATLKETQAELENYIGKDIHPIIDTLSITETRETYKKGLLGKLKSAIVGEKVQQHINTKLRVQSGTDAERNSIRQAMISALQVNKVSVGSKNFNELVKKTVELKESELKLIRMNNSLIEKIQGLIEEVKASIRHQEAEHNNLFIKLVRHSTDFLQNILIVLMLLACGLSVYILLLAHRNGRFQDNIISLNEKIMKDSVEKDKFYSIVSHDIMNPFNALLGFSKILKDAVKEGDQKEIEECTEIVHQSADRISNLLQNLLVWSRVQNGKMQFQPIKLGIAQLVNEAMSIVAPIAKNKDIKLSWEVKDELQVTLDKNMIISVVQNLATNAIKFTQKGGEVNVSVFQENGMLNFLISDTGVGMTEEQLQKLFRLDKASSSRGTDDETGTGLGLIISKEFVEKHAGRIWAESTLGKGSRFCFQLPLNIK